ncbi:MULTISPECIES: helix-turn-helix domain-containing protein [Amycolatopsis]|uniref:Helix-turn-helix transcriptional regulator n=1 Tax=Amycolatopsis tucumanensis TaxID=401106 RepID=A0ABP7HCF4_9PSEU|nr:MULTISPECIES: helix-turn-helix domain-containing protein [Amycolatopsis]MCF6423759.1 helix-turn-helix domain-containing protein [Amycolatopsis tucumanensis]
MGERRDAFIAQRCLMGYTQEAFATAVGVEFTTVGRWERGELTPQPWRRGRIAKALGVTLEELGALLSPDIRRNSQRPAPSEQRVVHVPPGDPSEEDDMNRRSLLRLFSMAGAFLSLPEPADAVTESVGRTTANSATVAAYSQLNRYLWRAYALAPSKGTVLPPVRAQLEILSEALTQAQTPHTRQHLCALAADLFQLAGEILFDADRYGDAAHCYTLAATAGKESSAIDLWACALTRHAYIAVYERRFSDAAPLLDLAATLARRGDPSLPTRHWIAAVQAETHAGLGDLDACQRALDTATEVLQLPQPPSNRGWLRFDGSRLPELRGTCYLSLGRTDLAERALTDALQSGLTLRREAAVVTDLALLGLKRQDPDQVAAYAGTAVSIARQTGSAVVIRKLQVLQQHLSRTPAHPRIRQLTADIHALSTLT